MNLPLGTAGTQLSRPRSRELVITRYRMLNKHTIPWMTLNPDLPFQADL
jgi:hypothetical protein